MTIISQLLTNRNVSTNTAASAIIGGKGFDTTTSRNLTEGGADLYAVLSTGTITTAGSANHVITFEFISADDEAMTQNVKVHSSQTFIASEMAADYPIYATAGSGRRDGFGRYIGGRISGNGTGTAMVATGGMFYITFQKPAFNKAFKAVAIESGTKS